ncbi:hypothetical protein A9Z42_0087810 [Trichoderma parareesei]|uniref:Uncharacterized protein n=1 Tax=Trichoderma parareesei TaxID=858221 RepID=A0A2H3A7H4_TRIPA|nr:hypothetical protein A9Z42_0087810 [Trichoderma parareesei]
MTWCSFPTAAHERQSRRGSEGAQEGGQGSGSVTGGGRLRWASGGSNQELSKRVEVEAANMTFRGEERGSRAG